MASELLLVTPEGMHRPVDNTYEAIKEALDGATLDTVALGSGEESFFVDDEAMYRELMFNVPASLMTGIALFGPVVLCGPPDSEGETQAPSARARMAMMNMADIWQAVCLDAAMKGQAILALANAETLPPPVVISLDNDQFDAWLRGEGLRGEPDG